MTPREEWREAHEEWSVWSVSLFQRTRTPLACALHEHRAWVRLLAAWERVSEEAGRE